MHPDVIAEQTEESSIGKKTDIAAIERNFAEIGHQRKDLKEEIQLWN